MQVAYYWHTRCSRVVQAGDGRNNHRIKEQRMESTNQITGSGKQDMFLTQSIQSLQAPVQQQKSGFFKVSANDKSLVANTYSKNGSVEKVQINQQSGFDTIF
jgi:hypothetical protein